MKYKVWCDNYDTGPEEGLLIDAVDSSQAAELWAKHHDQTSAEYSIAHGDSVVVHVRPETGVEILSFEVYGEAVPHYWIKPTTRSGGRP